MFDKILVPLDGSTHADEVLPQVKRILLRKDARVDLLGVIVPILERRSERGGRADSSEERHVGLRREETQRHLDKVRDELVAQGAQVTSHVVLGDPTEVILKKVEEQDVDLVAMATHGRRGPSRWVRGSTAERVLRRCPVPVLMVNPGRIKEEEHKRFQKILVPVDGSRQSEEILPLVAEVGRLYESEVVLLRVKVQPLDPYYSLPWANEDLEDSLDRYEKELANQVREVSRRVRVGDPAIEILAAVEEEQVDMVAMTTHGLSGLSRWLFGSVAEKVLRSCTEPLLLKRTGLQED